VADPRRPDHVELIDRSLLTTRAGTLPPVLIGEIDDDLRAILGI
jgi:mRNA-degrading endonuclease toxin of MazEF toxin-antitoxin module